jgi:hypothetical protein
MAASSSDRDRLFRQVQHSLGAPIRKIELTNEMLDTLLEIVIEDYSMIVQEFLIDNQWSSLVGQNIDTTDIAFALTTRSIDFETQFTYAYSKQVGLQARGPWELKKDFIELVSGQQVYQIPAGREINQILYITPTSTNQALFGQNGGFDGGFGGGYSQVGGGYGATGLGQGGNGGYYIAPASDVLMRAADYNLKNKLLRSELCYKLTAGPNGTRLLHLMSTPGSKLSMGHGSSEAGNIGITSGVGLVGSKVWYHYYETTADNLDACRKANKDIIKLPNEVPLDRLDFTDFNEPTKVLIRQLLIAESKRTLGRVRGKFSGVIKVPDAELTMDYESLLSEGNDEKIAALEKLTERLIRLSSTTLLERKANEADNLNRTLKYRPMGFFVY